MNAVFSMYGQYGIFLLKNIHRADIDAFAALYAGADIKKYYFVVCYLVLFLIKKDNALFAFCYG